VEPSGLLVHQRLPPFVGVDQFGEEVSIDQFHGEFVVLRVTDGSTWRLTDAQRTVDTFNAGHDYPLQWIDVTFDDDAPGDPGSFLREQQIQTLPVISSSAPEARAMLEAGRSLGTWIIDPGWVTRVFEPRDLDIARRVEQAYIDWQLDPDPASPCTDDLRSIEEVEPNGVDLHQDLHDLNGPVDLYGSAHDLGVADNQYIGDIDLFDFTPRCPSVLRAELYGIETSTDLDLALYDLTSERWAAWADQTGMGRSEELVVQLEIGSRYFVRVAGRAGTASDWNLDLSFE
jgi:hypothetical protein